MKILTSLLRLLIFPSRQTQCSCTSSYPMKPSCRRLIANQVMAHPSLRCQHTNKRRPMYMPLDYLFILASPITSRLLNIDPRWPRFFHVPPFNYQPVTVAPPPLSYNWIISHPSSIVNIFFFFIFLRPIPADVHTILKDKPPTKHAQILSDIVLTACHQ